MNDSIEKGRKLIASSKLIVGFTGAGVSAESGIPTYRGADGLWKSYDSSKYADINYFFSNPSYYWSFFKDIRYRTLIDSKPNNAHFAIAKLEAQGKLETVITQNIDGLHRDAGNTDVIELHGNTREIGCLSCRAVFDYHDVFEMLKTKMPPTCSNCGGMLKPKVVFFGEQLPFGAMEHAALAVSKCDLILVVGSTLEVHPAASLPVLAKRNGAGILIVNLGETAMDNIADCKIDAKAGEVLPMIIDNNI